MSIEVAPDSTQTSLIKNLVEDFGKAFNLDKDSCQKVKECFFRNVRSPQVLCPIDKCYIHPGKFILLTENNPFAKGAHKKIYPCAMLLFDQGKEHLPSLIKDIAFISGYMFSLSKELLITDRFKECEHIAPPPIKLQSKEAITNLYDGSLYTALKNPLSPSTVIEYFIGAAKGLKALHDQGYVHGDLNMGNILTLKGGQAVLIDFDSTRKKGKELPFSITPMFAPKEDLMTPSDKFTFWGTNHSEPVCAPSRDIWAIGIMLAYIFCPNAYHNDSYNLRPTGCRGDALKNVLNDFEISWRNSTPDAYKKNLMRRLLTAKNRLQEDKPSERLKNLIYGCLEINPEERWSIDQVIDALQMLPEGQLESSNDLPKLIRRKYSDG